MDALPWLLFVLVSAALAAALNALRLSSRDLADALTDAVRRDAEHDAAMGEARTAYRQMRYERDRAQGTVRDLRHLLDAQNALYRHRPLPSAGNALTEQFTKIVERHRWPEVPPT